ncbi:MAG: 2-oxo acid dehydrogenase subunit E2 [Armatimonadetes bacterium]|nr:2-oxo acid dehydrogenase subunit E2 [Armatimonadota bacterium]
MAEFKLPELGENIQAADVLSVLVAEGDPVEIDQPVLEIETDKATIEVPSTVAGVVTRVHVQAGDKARVGSVVFTVEEKEPARAAAAPAPPVREEPAAPAAQRAEQRPTEQPGPEQRPTEQRRPELDRPAVRASAAPPQVSPVAPHTPGANGGAGKRRVPAAAAPSIRRLAREIGVDINAVTGTGPGGRISAEDVKAQAKRLLLSQPAAPQQSAVSMRGLPLPDFSRWGEVEIEKMSGIRRKTAEQMALAWGTVPMVTQFDKADLSHLERLRTELQPKAKQHGAKLTVTAILLKIAASALKRFPQFNASIDIQNEQVVYKKYFHIGVAVDTERGLLVPVIRDVERKNIFELAVELQELAEKARNRKISPDELQGASFTITNLGGIGGTGFTPIVNPPEVAILGVSRSGTEPVFSDGQFRARMMLPLSLSYDHRLIDGAAAARFLRWICEAVEEPGLLAFEG